MPELALTAIVPTRERPHVVRELAEAFAATCTRPTRLMLAVDASDPTRHAYIAALAAEPVGWLSVHAADSSNMVAALNLAAATVETGAVAFLGDDHRPRTHGWDAAYLDALAELGTGIVYGDDLLQRQNLPTQVAMTTDIVRALGFMAPPTLTHLYVDNFWRDLGQAAGCLRYLPDVVIEHMHPVAGKAVLDEGYERVNNPAMYHRDRTAYARFVAGGGLQAAADKVRALR